MMNMFCLPFISALDKQIIIVSSNDPWDTSIVWLQVGFFFSKSYLAIDFFWPKNTSFDELVVTPFYVGVIGCLPAQKHRPSLLYFCLARQLR